MPHATDPDNGVIDAPIREIAAIFGGRDFL
jgi:hypothetical protein